MNRVEVTQDTPGHILTTLQIAYVQDGLVKGGSIIVWDTMHRAGSRGQQEMM